VNPSRGLAGGIPCRAAVTTFAIPGAPTRARRELILAAREYRTKHEALGVLLERDVARAKQELERRRSLQAQGVAARREVEAVETGLEAAREQVRETRSRIAEADRISSSGSASLKTDSEQSNTK
jgi:multidrug resistance efflux pump